MSPLRSPSPSMRAVRAWRAAMLTLFVVLGLTAAGVVAGLSANGADAPPGTTGVRTDPAAGAVLARRPNQLTLHLPDTSAGAPGTAGEVTVYRADHSVAAHGPLTGSAADPATLQFGLPALGKGVFTVAWSLGGGTQGAFAFAVDPAGASSAAVHQPPATSTLPPPLRVAVGWLPWVAVSVLTGVAALRVLVTGPVARQLGGEPIERGGTLAATDARLVRIAAAAAAVLLPASIVQLAYQPKTDGFAFGDVLPALTADLGGYLDLARLVVTALAVAVLLPVATAGRRLGGAAGPALRAAFVLGLLELVARAVPAKPPTDVRAVTNTVLVVGHLFGAALWIGGLVGITALAAVTVVPERDRRQFWPAAIRRFATVAMSSVLALVLSGLWLTWSHVGGLAQFLTTLYGRALAVKLLLFGALLALGAFHEFWLLPRVEAYRAIGDGPRLIRGIARHFRSAVAAEVALGLAVLMVVPMLSGSARAQALQAAALTHHATAGDTPVTLTTSGSAPGLTDYLVTVPDGAARQVTVSFAAPALGIPATEVPATAIGGGQYRVSGMYTPVVGGWEARVSLDGARQAVVKLTVTSRSAKPPRPAPPALTGAIWGWGIAIALLLVGMLVGAGWLSRRLTTRMISRAVPAEELVPAPRMAGGTAGRAPVGRAP
ncbi:MAG TPA: CopD family protein [Kineosporiaceae bacterium]